MEFSCSPRKIIIAIDGVSSSGKSTFARKIAARLGYIFIDTGAMYRAVTLLGRRAGVVTHEGIDCDALVRLLDRADIAFRFNPDREASDIYLNGERVEDEIRTIEVSNLVSAVSQIPEVRRRLVSLQQKMGAGRGVVMDGRDIGTVVFPDAELKIYMTANPAVRAERRYRELLQAGEKVSLEEIEQNIRERDAADSNRLVSPLRQAPDAMVLDNSNMTLEEQMGWVEERLKIFSLY